MSMVTLRERQMMRGKVTTATTSDLKPVTRFEDYRDDRTPIFTTAVAVVVGTIFFLILAKLGVFPDWLVQWAMPRIYS